MTSVAGSQNCPSARHLTLTAFGIPVGVTVGGSGRDDLAAHLLDVWAWCDVREVASPDAAQDSAAAPGAHVTAVLDPDEAVVDAAHEAGWVAGTALEIVSEVLTPAITAAALEAASGDLVMLHAAALADEDGRTVALVGRSGAGKSTAVRVLGALPEVGWHYVTDETVAVGADGAPRHFAKPLSLFPAGRKWGKIQHSPASLGLSRAPESLSLNGVVFLERDPEATAVQVRAVDETEALVRLGEQSSYLSFLNRPLHRMAEVVRTAGAHAVRYADAADLAPLLSELVSAQRVVPADPMALPAPLAGRPTGAAPVTRWAAAVLDDLHVAPEGGVAFQQGRLVALSPLALAALHLVDARPGTLGELTAALVDWFGVPEGDPEAVTASLLAELVQNSLAVEVPVQHDFAPEG